MSKVHPEEEKLSWSPGLLKFADENNIYVHENIFVYKVSKVVLQKRWTGKKTPIFYANNIWTTTLKISGRGNVLLSPIWKYKKIKALLCAVKLQQEHMWDAVNEGLVNGGLAGQPMKSFCWGITLLKE